MLTVTLVLGAVAFSGATPYRGGPGGGLQICLTAAHGSKDPSKADIVCEHHAQAAAGIGDKWFNPTSSEKKCLKTAGIAVVGGILYGIAVEMTGGEALEWATTARQTLSAAAAGCVAGNL